MQKIRASYLAESGIPACSGFSASSQALSCIFCSPLFHAATASQAFRMRRVRVEQRVTQPDQCRTIGKQQRAAISRFGKMARSTARLNAAHSPGEVRRVDSVLKGGGHQHRNVIHGRLNTGHLELALR